MIFDEIGFFFGIYFFVYSGRVGVKVDGLIVIFGVFVRMIFRFFFIGNRWRCRR